MKVGDKVVGLGTNAHYDVTCRGWKGEIIEIINSNEIVVYGPWTGVGRDEAWHVDPVHFVIDKEDNFDKLYLTLKS